MLIESRAGRSKTSTTARQDLEAGDNEHYSVNLPPAFLDSNLEFLELISGGGQKQCRKASKLIVCVMNGGLKASRTGKHKPKLRSVPSLQIRTGIGILLFIFCCCLRVMLLSGCLELLSVWCTRFFNKNTSSLYSFNEVHMESEQLNK